MPIRTDNISITIGGVDYSIYINEYTDSGGDYTYTTKKCFGNRYRKIVTGREPYELELKFRVEDDTLQTLFENESVIQIVITMVDDDAATTTITYSNMLPDVLNIEIETDEIVQGVIKYSTLAISESGIDNRTIV